MKKILKSMFALAMAALTFTSCEDVPEPYDIPTEGGEETIVIEPTGSGTEADPYNVAAALELVSAMESNVESTSNVYIKGKVVSITTNYDESGTFGNAVFYISDDGTNKNQFYVYRALYLGNQRYSSGTTLQEGDEVVVCGKVVNYNGTTPETVQSQAYLYSLNGESGGGSTPPEGASGSGTLEDPFNAAGVIAYINTLGADNESPTDVYIKGKVASITEQYGTQFGNATFDISDDGTANNKFTVYRALYLGNQRYSSGTLLKEGDEVVVCGRVVNYRGNTPETVQNKAYLYSLNGEGGGETPDTPGEPKGTGTLEDPYNAAGVIAYINTLGADNESPNDVYIKGKVASITEQYGTQFGNATFNISDDGTANNQFTVYRALYLGNERYSSGTLLKEGDEVVICGKVVNYRGNTPETVQNKAYLYSLNSEGGGDDPEPSGAGTYDEPLTVSQAIAKGTVSGAWVTSYIVGWVEGQVYTSGIHFSAEDCSSQTNIVIAETPGETDPSKCMPVQLPKGDLRSGLNLQENASLYGKQLLIYGNLETYFSVPGLKAPTYAEADGKSFGKKP